MTTPVFNIDDLNQDNRVLMTLLHGRYGQNRSQAYTCLMLNRQARIKVVYEWVKTGKIKLNMFELFCNDFVQAKFQPFKQDDISSMIKYIKNLN